MRTTASIRRARPGDLIHNPVGQSVGLVISSARIFPNHIGGWQLVLWIFPVTGGELIELFNVDVRTDGLSRPGDGTFSLLAEVE